MHMMFADTYKRTESFAREKSFKFDEHLFEALHAIVAKKKWSTGNHANPREQIAYKQVEIKQKFLVCKYSIFS